MRLAPGSRAKTWARRTCAGSWPSAVGVVRLLRHDLVAHAVLDALPGRGRRCAAPHSASRPTSISAGGGSMKVSRAAGWGRSARTCARWSCAPPSCRRSSARGWAGSSSSALSKRDQRLRELAGGEERLARLASGRPGAPVATAPSGGCSRAVFCADWNSAIASRFCGSAAASASGLSACSYWPASTSARPSASWAARSCWVVRARICASAASRPSAAPACRGSRVSTSSNLILASAGLFSASSFRPLSSAFSMRSARAACACRSLSSCRTFCTRSRIWFSIEESSSSSAPFCASASRISASSSLPSR